MQQFPVNDTVYGISKNLDDMSYAR